MKVALVLSGGGARGAYQVGVWKALRKLNKKIDIVTGTSIGALNGCLFAQNDYYKTVKLWENVNFTNIFNDDEDIDFKTMTGKKNILKKYINSAIVGGMDLDRMESFIKAGLDLNKLNKSKIKFGLVTVNAKTMEPLYLTADKINKEQFADYLMASATVYPIFKKKEIDNEVFIDGGFHDNLPINLAIQMGAEEIIAVDLNSFGAKKKVSNKNIKITYIKPTKPIGNFLIFDGDIAKIAIKHGYNDTMKILGNFEGEEYTFKPNHIEFNLFLHGNKLKKNMENFLSDKAIVKHSLKYNIFNDLIISSTNQDFKKSMINNLEFLAKTFELDNSMVYGIFSLHNKLFKGLDGIENIDLKMIEDSIKKGNIKKILKRQNLIKYLYDKIKRQDDPKTKKELINISLIFPNEFLGALYLYTVRGR